MQKAFAIPLILLFAACEANVSDTNDSVTLEYDENVAESTADTVINETEEIAGDISNDVQDTASALENRADQTDVDVDVDTNTADGTN